MTIPPKLPIEIVSKAAQLDSAVKAMLSSRDVALDTESNSFYRYPEQLCLIQIATHHKVYLIDTIVLNEIAPFKRVLADAAIVKVIHGADYDIRSLDHRYGFRIHNLYDTSIAARFAGLTKFGLGSLVEDLLGVTILKSKRLQRADWGQRPLSAEAVDYAAADVRYLFALREVLTQRTQVLGRTEWVAEECARLEEVRYSQPNLETAYLSIKGARDLDGRGLAILRSLVLFREEEAQRQHRPHFYIIPDATIVSMAMNPATILSNAPGLGQFRRGLQQAIRDGLAAPPIRRPPVIDEPMSRAQVRRLMRLKAWRISLGKALSLDASLLWPMASLERLARAPDTLDAELVSPEVRRWQRDRFGSALRACLAT